MKLRLEEELGIPAEVQILLSGGKLVGDTLHPAVGVDQLNLELRLRVTGNGQEDTRRQGAHLAAPRCGCLVRVRVLPSCPSSGDHQRRPPLRVVRLLALNEHRAGLLILESPLQGRPDGAEAATNEELVDPVTHATCLRLRDAAFDPDASYFRHDVVDRMSVACDEIKFAEVRGVYAAAAALRTNPPRRLRCCCRTAD